MQPILSEICQWAKQQPAWEQETLRLLLAGELFEETIYATLGEMLVEGKGAKAVDLSKFEIPAVAQEKPRPLLVSISCISNVNALAHGQTIEFGPALTAIYGLNAVGKSSYARIFGSVCFTRGDREVLPNIFEVSAESLPQRAKLTIDCAGEQQVIEHVLGQPVSELAGFFVFDSTCVATHLTKANTLTFSPAGLSVLQDLVKHTDKVRDLVTRKVDEADRPHVFAAIFDAPTAVAAQIQSLSSRTDLVALKALGNLSGEEELRIVELERELARLKLLDVRKAIRLVQSHIGLLQSLIRVLPVIEVGASDARLLKLGILVAERAERRENAKRAGAEQFAVDGLRTVGSNAWNEFIHAARRLADGESHGEELYPVSGARCLLCQQDLSPDAAQLLHRLWDFLKGEAKRLLGETEARLSARRSGFDGLQCNVCESGSAIHALLEENEPALLAVVTAFLSVAECRRRATLAAIDGAAVALPDLPALPASPAAALEELEAKWTLRLKELEDSDPAQQITARQSEHVELDHRRLLGRHFHEIAAHVELQKWAEAVRKKIKSSKHITLKYNELFEERVTGQYRRKFEEFLTKLGRPLRARIGTRGQKGAAVKTLELTVPEGSSHTRMSPQQVFSEGEKRAVVLADFLTEVALDAQAAGIVLDDPVTSLDAEWKETIARLLVEQARERQVIIFTHDLHFLYLLKSAAEQGDISLKSHWMRRSSEGQPGHISLDNSPASEKDYRNPQKATEFYNRAAKAEAEEQEMLLRAGFGALRTSYEVLVLVDCFNEVVKRFDERISMERLREVVTDPACLNAIADKIGTLSRFIEGHSHSDIHAAAAPLTVKTLRDEIESFTQLKARIKELKKQR